jgi:hypothetical protein
MVVIFRFLQKAWNFLTSSATITSQGFGVINLKLECGLRFCGTDMKDKCFTV